jgi:cytochrome b561
VHVGRRGVGTAAIALVGKKPNIASVALHWVSAWAMILALHFGLHAVYGSNQREAAFLAHAYAGLAVLGITVARLFLRALLPWPNEEPGASRVGAMAAGAVHWALYAMMLLTPLAGWIVASSMCCMTVPGLPSIDRLSADMTDGRPVNAMAACHVHVFFAWMFFALASLHVLAALFHHFVVKDAVLIGMLPISAQRGSERSMRAHERRK